VHDAADTDPAEADLPPVRITDACTLGAADPTQMLVTTTDFATGSVTVIDIATKDVRADVAHASTDAIPFAHDGRAYLVNRFGHDFIDVLEPANWRSLGQHGLRMPDVQGTNPQAIAFDAEGLAYVPLMGSGSVAVMDLAEAPGKSLLATIDLGTFADPDGNPEPTLAVACGHVLLVAIARLDPSFVPVDFDAVVAIDMTTRTPLDFDPEVPGAQPLALLGTGLKQLRLDPRDSSGRTLLGLTSGIERIDLAAGEVAWEIDEQAFLQAGIEGSQHAQAFAVDQRGRAAYVAAYSSDFSQVQLYHAPLGDPAGAPTPILDGMYSVERSLEVVGTELWYGSSAMEDPGVWVYDVAALPPTLVAGPLATGLPPYAMAGM
jgi:hypothetical protein